MRRVIVGPHEPLIGEAAPKLAPDASSVFLNVGTTTQEAARARNGHSGLLVVMNDLRVAAELCCGTSIEVVVAGSGVRRSDGGIVEADSIALIAHLRVDAAGIGSSTVDTDEASLECDTCEVQAQRAIVEHARRLPRVAEP